MNVPVADAELKTRHRAMWGSGDYPTMVETFLLPIGQRLADACAAAPAAAARGRAAWVRAGARARHCAQWAAAAAAERRAAGPRGRRRGGRERARRRGGDGERLDPGGAPRCAG